MGALPPGVGVGAAMAWGSVQQKRGGRCSKGVGVGAAEPGGRCSKLINTDFSSYRDFSSKANKLELSSAKDSLISVCPSPSLVILSLFFLLADHHSFVS